MANIKSAKKRIKVIERKSAENRVLKSALKTQLKKFDAAVASEAEDLTSIYNETVSKVDKAVTKGIIHANKAARTKASLAKKLAK
ncbi:MAG: 30S ribosomal protein S20 [Clostridiales bacterium]|nr:MAG: 30S ribosomal protein S20 [Clostridiales bacterium]